ncbi:hypothetical protein VRRI112168_00520 [Vreelandella rituensis]|uniref:hypothetical protein n=1 Tax=Vreelandella rituensis TaxID=2282306 RepID=UPI0015F053FC|nr:hypothetical protein [Halomonas rituensis]
MKLKSLSRVLVAAGLVASISGCASIVGNPEQTLTFTSTPSQAGLSITDERGKEVFDGNTPSTVSLRKSDGTYFGGKTYRVSFSKPGYRTHEITLDAKPNGWYVGGNLLMGGIVGWLIVDPWNGNMYTLGPDYVDTKLRAGTAMSGGGDINVALISEIAEEAKPHLQLVYQSS